MITLKGSNGIIFGSTGYLGHRLALRLSQLGCKLILHGRSIEKLSKLDDEIKTLVEIVKKHNPLIKFGCEILCVKLYFFRK